MLAAGCGSRASLQQPAAPARRRLDHARPPALPRRRHRGRRRHRAPGARGARSRRAAGRPGEPEGQRRVPAVAAARRWSSGRRAAATRRARCACRSSAAAGWSSASTSPRCSGRCTARRPARTQAHAAIGLRPPFRVVWSRGLGSLIEFPAVVSDGVAYVGNNHGTVYALSMRERPRPLAARRPAGRWPPRPRSPATSSSSTAWTASSACSTAAPGGLRFAVRVGSPIESSPIVRDRIDYFGAWNGNVYALDLRTRRFRWSLPRRLEDHLERRARRPHALHRRLRRPAARARAGQRAPALVCRRERADLRHARGVGRARLRALVGRRLADGVHDPRALPLARPHRQLRLLVAGGLGRPRLLRLLQRPPLLRLGLERPASAGRCRPAARSRARRRSWTASSTRELRPPDRRRRRADAAGSLLRFPHGEYVPVSGSGGRLLLHGYSRLYAVEPA